MRTTITALSTALLLTFSIGCSSKKSVSASEVAVGRFHQQFNAGKFNDIYNDTTERFQSTTPLTDYQRFMTAIREKLGRAGTSTRVGSSVFVTMSATNVSLSYDTQFEHGKGREVFQFVDKGGGPRLQHYKVNSAALVLR